MDILRLLPNAVLQSRADAIVVTDRQGCIHFWNPGAAHIFGFDMKEAVGQSLDLIIPDNLRARHWEGYRHFMATGRSRYGEGDLLSVPALTKDGHRISVEFTIILLSDEEHAVVGAAAVMRDVTQRFEQIKALRRKVATMEAVAPTNEVAGRPGPQGADSNESEARHSKAPKAGE